jgi:hypothetical protein
MVARLGNVLYWIGCGVAVLLVASGIMLWVGEGYTRSDHGIPGLIGFAVMAVLCWLIGRACRYVLSGI